MMSSALMAAFIDEMELMAEESLEKQAFMANLGTAIKSTAKSLGGHIKDIGPQIGSTLQKTFTNPIQSAREGLKYTLDQSLSGSAGMKALGIGGLALQGYQGVRDVKGLRTAEDPTGQGRGRGQRLGELVGSTAGGFIGAPHGIAGGIVGSEVARRGLGAVGRGVDRAVAMARRKPQAAAMSQGPVQE